MCKALQMLQDLELLEKETKSYFDAQDGYGTLHGLKDMMQQKYKLHRSSRWYGLQVKNFGMQRRQDVQGGAYVNTKENISGRQRWAKEVVTLLEKDYVVWFIDETGYQRTRERKKSW